jgi:hypothetical protein
MSSPRPPFQGDDTPLNPPDADIGELGRELTGDQPEGDQAAYFRQSEVSEDDLEPTDTELYEGELGLGATDTIEDLAGAELRDGETDNPDVAAEEGLTWVPPIDPPVVPDLDDPQGVRVAAGFGTSSDDEPFDPDHVGEALSAEGEVEERIREALRADASTSMYADSLVIGTRGSLVAVRGLVDDIDDTDNIVDVISRVSGISEVIEELEVRGVTD